jgi:hypothetical protein
VIEFGLQPSLERFQTAEVDNPVVVIQLDGFELEADRQGVTV